MYFFLILGDKAAVERELKEIIAKPLEQKDPPTTKRPHIPSLKAAMNAKKPAKEAKVRARGPTI